MKKKAVHFGAGNIGRGFIGLLLSQSGYHVDFVDVNETVIEHLRKKQSYRVLIAGETTDSTIVQDVYGINGKNLGEVAEAVKECHIVTTAVGVNVLAHIAQGIADGLRLRFEEKRDQPVNILACENAVGNTDVLRRAVEEKLTPELKKWCEEYVGFPNTTVDRIVPAYEGKQALDVMVEDFYEWNVEKARWKGDPPDIEGLQLVDNLSAYIERKLFTLNTTHAVCAYLGVEAGYEYIHDAVKDPKIRSLLEGVLKETGEVLIKKYGFDRDKHHAYSRKILARFANAALADRTVRVARDPMRKLSKEDRLIAPALESMKYGWETGFLITGHAAGP
ncbi:MAG TPA: mannitol-1-phosphate 5-dehydrogenase, partial [Eubacteriaceae bacterium]|nr:mannitol-1-phosphate 5-dehydrogenase [Eubacteriaceae bacterium]